LATIAAELGVSTASVSNALNRPERVSAGLRQRVLAVATRLGYAGPAAATRLLASGRADAIAVLFTAELPTALQDPAAMAFLGGISVVCESAGLSLVLIPDRSTQPGGRAAAVAEAIVDGFVVYSLRDGDPLLDVVLQRDVSTVVIDAPRTVSGADWVGADDRTAMRGLGDHLRKLGHREVGIIAPQLNETRLNGPVEPGRWSESGYALMRERIEGLLAGLHLDASAVVVEERFQADLAAGADALNALLQRRPGVTAVCCLTDLLALGALAAARQRGVVIPDQLTITGYDDIPAAAHEGLTTIAQQHAAKGRVAGEMLLTASTQAIDRRRLLPTQLQIRASAGRANR